MLYKCGFIRRRWSRSGAWGLRTGTILVALTFLNTAPVAGAAEGSASQSQRCLNCHAQEWITRPTEEDRGNTLSTMPTEPRQHPERLRFDSATFAKSVHAQFGCQACHTGAENLPHAPKLPDPTCEGCHPSQADLHLRGAHAEKFAEGDRTAPRCWTCHGAHDILPPTQRESKTHPLNVLSICTGCHQQHATSPDVPGTGQTLVQGYLDSVHGRAVQAAGLVVAATCPDCHRAHEVLPSRDPNSSVHRNHVPATCGKCHEGVSEVYSLSIHGQKLAQGDKNAPVCTDCHTAHQITRAAATGFTRDIIGECGECHDKPMGPVARRTSLYDTYRQSYHGQATGLGLTRAARCSDCHGAHDIRPIADPSSRLYGENRIATCRTCHPGADAGFASFEAHGDYRDPRRYPVLYGIWLYFIIVMSGAFGFYGLHSLLWVIRSFIERVRHGPAHRFAAQSHAILRFTKADRINHAFVIISFFGLTLTGIPLLYSDHEWARILSQLLGGANVAGILHRIFAIMLGGNFAAHIVVLIVRRRRHESLGDWLFGPNTMLPRVKDMKDCFGMFRWFFCGGNKPAFDRWTYWEKFDYSAELFGSLIIGGSGLMLWFPVFFSKLMPGWMFNVAMIVHGYEALLAAGFIFTIHFFNAHLRMEKFPVDDVIFTGRLPEEEFKHERGVEYARLVETGELEALRVPSAPAWWRPAAVVVGILAMAIGLTLVALIVLAGFGVL
jgi:cytochrome b subunit of formate dehydrogenase